MRIATTTLSLSVLLTSTLPAWAGIESRMFIDRFVSVPSSVLDVVGAVLPEGAQIGSSYLSETYNPNFVVSAPATVAVTFLSEITAEHSSLGYFTYTTDGQSITILDRQLVFPHVKTSFTDSDSFGQLVSGDTVTLRDATGAPRVFQPGTRIGFFLVVSGWEDGAVRGWDEASPAVPAADPLSNAANGVVTTIDEINPETSTGFLFAARHFAAINILGIPGFLDGKSFAMVGIEDLRRDIGSDDDFNDCVMVVHSNPPGAILDDSDIPAYDPTSEDPDGDGVTGTSDYFPFDPERAFTVRTPPSGWSTIVFEDNYPLVGDADYNDTVVEMAFEEVLRADGRLKDISGTFNLIARGASLNHRFGVALHGLPGGVDGTVEFERFTSSGAHELEIAGELGDFLYAEGGNSSVARIDTVFPSTAAAMVGDRGPFSNTVEPSAITPPATARFILTFATPLDRSTLGTAPFDPFLQILRSPFQDIHLSGFSGFPDRSPSLPEESGLRSFTDPAGYPFAMMVPTNWRYPLERVSLDGPEGAYPGFEAFRKSLGMESFDWYTFPVETTPARVVDTIAEKVRSRRWDIATSKLVESSLAAGWTRCAREGQGCKFSGPMVVRYGEGTSFSYGTFRDGVRCGSATFGPSNTTGPKTCAYAPLPPDGVWVRCAAEGATCQFTGTKVIAYGANGVFTFRTATGPVACNNTVFGGDPIVNTFKSCHVLSAAGVISDRARFLLNEGQGSVVNDATSSFPAATIVGNPTWVSSTIRGRSLTALSFDGATHVETTVPNGASRTLAAWIRPTASPPNGAIIDSDIPYEYGSGILLVDGQIQVLLDDEFWDTGIFVPANEWHHVALSFNSQLATLYLDGQEVATHGYWQWFFTEAPYFIGKSHANPVWFQGQIADARIFNSALNEAAVQLVYQGD